MWELRDYLRRKLADEITAGTILAKLQGLGMADDLAFAKAWVANRRLLKPVSKRRLVAELTQKRVPKDIITTVLDDDDTDERQTLRTLIAKKRSRYDDPQKLMAYLARQGFGYDDIKAAMQNDEEN